MVTRGWLLVGAIGIVAVFFAGTQTWVAGLVPADPVGAVEVEATGTEVSRLVTAAALMTGAGLLGGLIGSRPVRIFAGLVLVGGGVLAAVAAIDVIQDPAGAVAPFVAERTGVSGGGIDPAHTLESTGWPIAALSASLCIVGAGILRWWSPLSAADRNRQRRISAGAPTSSSTGGAVGGQAPAGSDAVIDDPRPAAAGRPADPWQELSEGRDPTTEPEDDEPTADDPR